VKRFNSKTDKHIDKSANFARPILDEVPGGHADLMKYATRLSITNIKKMLIVAI
jgi:hypothetical protein